MWEVRGVVKPPPGATPTGIRSGIALLLPPAAPPPICHSQQFRASEESDAVPLSRRRLSGTARNLLSLTTSLYLPRRSFLVRRSFSEVESEAGSGIQHESEVVASLLSPDALQVILATMELAKERHYVSPTRRLATARIRSGSAFAIAIRRASGASSLQTRYAENQYCKLRKQRGNTPPGRQNSR